MITLKPNEVLNFINNTSVHANIQMQYAIHPFIINKDKNEEYHSRKINLSREIRANRFGYNGSYCIMNVPKEEHNMNHLIWRIHLGRMITYYRDVDKKSTNRNIQDFDNPGVHSCFRKTKDTFGGTNILFLDVDNSDPNTEYTNLYDFIKTHNNYAMIYTSYNHTDNHHKFRVIYLLDEIITTEDKMKAIFSEISKGINCDSSCFTCDKGFFGNTNAMFFIPDQITPLIVSNYEIPPQSNNKQRVKMNTITSDIQLRQINKRNFNIFKKSCYVFNNMSDKSKVNHQEWFTIVNNLSKFKGTLKHTQQNIIGRWPNLDKFISTWNYQSTKNPGYISCDCRYKDKCSLLKFNPNVNSIFQFLTSRSPLNPKYMSTVKSDDIELSNLDTVYNNVESTFLDIVNNKPNGKLYVIHAETGLGKTHILKKHAIPALYCFKTHQLSDEFEIGTAFPVINPEFPFYEDIQYCYENGISSSHIIKDAFEKHPTDPSVIHYQNQLIAFRNSNISKITHSRLVRSNNISDIANHNTIIIDEDILTNLVEVGTIGMKYLFNMLKVLPKEISTAIRNELMNHKFPVGCNENVINDTVKFQLQKFIREKSKSKETYTGLVKFVESSHYTYSAYSDGLSHAKSFVPEIMKLLASGKKIIVLSATPNKKLYDHIFKDKLEFFSFPKIKERGTCTIFKPISCSIFKSTINRASSDSVKRIIHDICDHFGIPRKNIISYKMLKDKCDIDISGYFFNIEGFNSLSGQNILVFGLPMLPLRTYFVIANALEININDFCIGKQNIFADGYIYHGRTFDNDLLQAFHIHMIESEIVQSIGRARLLRNNCNVIVVSDIPFGNKYYDVLPINIEY